jgi:hypothetical protein
LKIELNAMVVDSKNSAFEKCFKSACKSEHFKINFIFLRESKMRKKSKFEKYVSIIIDS